MSKIKVDIDRVNDLTPSFSQVTTKVSNTTDKVASIRSQIDYRIKARHGIGDQLYKISNELQTIEKNMQKLVSFLQNSMDKYAEAEQKIARQVPMLPNVIGKNNITIDENGKIQVLNEYAQFNTDRPVDPNTGEYLFTYEGQRQVLGGNGSGTPDGLAQLGDLAYDFLFGDIETLFDPNASLSDKAIAAAFMLPIGKPLKAAKVAMDAVDNSKDIAKAVDKAENIKNLSKSVDKTENIKNLSKSVDKTKEIQDKTISDLEVKQLGEYIKDLEKKHVDEGTGNSLETRGYKPLPGERVTTKEEWELLNRERRIETNYPKPTIKEKNYEIVKSNPKYYTLDGEIKWPENRGVLGEPEIMTLKPGTIIDRFGYEGGTFVSPYGVPYEMRALAPETYLKPYQVYVVKKPIEVQAGKIAPWFDEPGLGTQYEFNQSVKKLIDQNIIERIRK